MGLVFLKVSVIIVLPVLHFGWGIADERNAALAAVSMAGELEVDPMVRAQVIEGIRFVNKSDHGLISFVAFPGFRGAGFATPNGIDAGNEDFISLD